MWFDEITSTGFIQTKINGKRRPLTDAEKMRCTNSGASKNKQDPGGAARNASCSTPKASGSTSHSKASGSNSKPAVFTTPTKNNSWSVAAELTTPQVVRDQVSVRFMLYVSCFFF